jgi:hypothetical protein
MNAESRLLGIFDPGVIVVLRWNGKFHPCVAARARRASGSDIGGFGARILRRATVACRGERKGKRKASA